MVSVNDIHVLFSLLYTPDDLVTQALVWLHIVQFRLISFGVVQFSTSYANLWFGCTLSNSE